VKDNIDLFHKMLIEFHAKGILNDVILIGSWVLPIYRHFFSNTPEIPILRTADVDFLIPNPPRISTKIDIPMILKEYDFEIQFSLLGNYTKFVHPDLEIEFFIPELGRSKSKAVIIKEFNITAQPLRYLHIVQNHILTVNYNDISIRVPEPAVFTLLKFLLTIKRKNDDKIKKDLKTAIELANFLLTKPEQIEKLKIIYEDMPKSWQNKIDPIIEVNCSDLFEVLKK